MWRLLLLALTCAGQSSDYCGITRQHTMCRNKGLGPLCGTPGERGLLPQEQGEVLDYHNRLRSRVARGLTSQPPAGNMRQLQWDQELARVAQRLADQCKFAHDCPDCRRVARFKVGQNLYQSFTTRTGRGVNWRAAVDSWFNEIDQFPTSSVHRYRFSPETGHYSQLVWAETDRIGCGVTQFKKGRFNARLYVCNYGTTGNIVRRPVYRQGSACSSCPCATECSTSYPGLCAPSNSSANACCDNLLCMLTRPDIITNEITDMTMDTMGTMGDMAMGTLHGAMHTAHGMGHMAMHTAHGVGNLAMGTVRDAMVGAHDVGQVAMGTAHNVGHLAMDTVHGVGNEVNNLVQDSAKLVGRGFRPVTNLVSQGVDFQRLTFEEFLRNNFFGKK